MKVSLKKASALAKALDAVPLKIEHTFRVEPLAGPPSDQNVQDLQKNLAAQINAALQKHKAVFSLRRIIGETNKAEIHGLLTNKAEAETALNILNALPSREKGTDLNVLYKQVEQALLRPDQAPEPYRGNRIFGGGKDITLELAVEPLIGDERKALRKIVRTIDDRLAYLNFTTEVELPEDVVALLTQFDLI